MSEFEPDHIEINVKPVDLSVLKDLALGTLKAVHRVVRMPRQFASHGDHTFDHPLDVPVEQPAATWVDPVEDYVEPTASWPRPIPDVAGGDLLPNIHLGDE